MGKRARIKLHDRNFSNDINYRGPLSYRHLRMFAWLFLILSQVAVILKLAAMVNKAYDFGWITDNIARLSSLVVPLFLIANFSEIMTSQKNYKSVIIRYAVMTVGAALLFFYFFLHISGGMYKTFIAPDSSVKFRDYSMFFFKTGYFSYNVFMDLLLCTLFMFFLDYTPKKFFKGKWIIAFRLMAILPVAYELVCIVLKINASMLSILLSPFWYPFLTTKPPFCFLAFVALGISIYVRKRRYMKYGNTEEQYHEYLRTNSNSLAISVRMAVIFIVMAFLDLLVMVFLGEFIVRVGHGPSEMVAYMDMAVINSGFGDSIVLIIMAPIVLLYSYNKKHSRQTVFIDAALPLVAIILMALVYIEGFYRVSMLFARMHETEITVVKNLPGIIPAIPKMIKNVPEIVRELPVIIQEHPEVLQYLPEQAQEFLQAYPDLLSNLPEIMQNLPELVQNLPETIQSHPEIIQYMPATVQEYVEANPDFLQNLPGLVQQLQEFIENLPNLLQLVLQMSENYITVL